MRVKIPSILAVVIVTLNAVSSQSYVDPMFQYGLQYGHEYGGNSYTRKLRPNLFHYEPKLL